MFTILINNPKQLKIFIYFYQLISIVSAMKKTQFTILLVFLSGLLYGQKLNQTGHPFITNFPSEVYNSNEQVWSIAQDDRGILYFGTQEDGIVEYDGKTWRKIPVPDNKPVYSMAKGNDGVIYIGTSGDFGYLEPTINGSLRYTSLIGTIADSIRNQLSAIYKTYYHNNKAYFCSSAYIFEFDGDTVIPIHLTEKYNLFTFLLNGKFYTGNFLKGLMTLTADRTLQVAKGGDFYVRKNIYSITPVDPDTYLIFTNLGVYRYNPKNGKSVEIDTPGHFIRKMVEKSILPYHTIRLNNGNIGVATVQSRWQSILEFTSSINPVNIINPEAGLHASQATYLFQHGESPLWAGFYDGGIAKIENHSSIRHFGPESGLQDMIVDITRFNGTLYLATLKGVYYQIFDSRGLPKFVPVNGINGTVWSLLIFTPPSGKPRLLAGSYVNGVYEIKGGQAYSISEPLTRNSDQVQHRCYSLYQSKIDPNILYIGMPGGVSYIEWRNGHWTRTDNLAKERIRFNIRSLGEDSKGNLWLGTDINGVYLVTPHQKVIHYNITENNQSLKQLVIYPEKDSLFLLTSKGIFHYDYKDSSFVKGGLLGGYADSSGIYRIVPYQKGYAAFCYDDVKKEYWISCFGKKPQSGWTAIRRPFRRLPNKWTDALYTDDSLLWIGTAKTLYSYNPGIKRTYQTPFRALIRKVVAKDSLLFNGAFYTSTDSERKYLSTVQQSYQIPKLSYRYNGIIVNFSAPYFEEEGKVVYSHYLEGSDETDWSHWDSKTEATYTNLREGKYVFHVKARNIYGKESKEATFTFEIAPPWYRTLLAFFFYIVLFILFVWGVVKWNTRRLIAEKERLEQIVKERTAEVVAQKEEIEQQKERIAVQNEEITSSIQYASRIQTALLTPSDQITKMFPEHFLLYLPRDIVSGDFYFFSQIGDRKIAVAADCTGHGVPGGFMSMLGISFLTQIISESAKDINAAEILNRLRSLVIRALHQTSAIGGSKDGMDIALYIYNEKNQTVEFAGANNPLIIIRDNEVIQIKGDKMPIGIHIKGEIPFTNHVIEVKKGDLLYTFSDGYVDQFGGEFGRKFMIKNFKKLLLEIHQKPLNEQQRILYKTLLNWHGDTPRIDDIVVLGVKIT